VDQIPVTVLIGYLGASGGGRLESAARLRARGTNARNLGFVLGLLRRRLLPGSAMHSAPGGKPLRQLILGGSFSTLALMSIAQADPIKIVAAENFYGDIAKQIGGPDVAVTSILNNPDQDPHLFEVSPSVGRDVSGARIVIYNGIDYDPWMEKLLRAARSANRTTIVVADLVGKKAGDNPHIWYDPVTMSALAKTVSDTLSIEDPAHRAGYERRLAQFEESLRPIEAKIGELRQRLAGTPVTATEPVFGYMFDALGMQVRNEAFQLAVMNNTEPSASDVAAFENDLKTHQGKLLIYNSQATDPIADRMQKIAKASGVPLVGATETEPAGENYQGWMTSVLDAIDRALPEQQTP
jgi:zinc/manganese transport system substrate-binding protein